MKIDLSKKITEYAKKILVIILIIHICILSIGNTGVMAESALDKVAYEKTPTDEEVKDYIKAMMEYTDDFAAGMRPEWDQMFKDDYDINYDSTEANSTIHYRNERAALYLIDKYKKTGSSDLYDFDKWWDIAEMTALQVDKDSPNYNYGDETLEEVDKDKWNDILNDNSSVLEESKKEQDEAKNENKEELGDTDNALLNVLDGIAGVLFIGFKIVPIIIGGAIQLIMNVSSGEDITIYNILFNEVGITDINFFENANHGGNVSTVNTIRENVAIWYVSLRNLAAVVLALILIYVAIRMAISTIAEEKAKYKKMVIDWLTSFCLLFVLHYIMVIVINLNNNFVELLKNAASDVDLNSVGGELVSQSFSTLKFTEGVGCAVAYMMLVGMSFIYFFAYVKRMITLAFLIIISPLITITYSIDKMGDGKSQALNTWLKEFVYNILIQPFQCVIYLSLVSTVLGMLTGEATTNLLKVFLAVYVLMFMYQAEEIVKNIFGFKSQSMGKTVAMAAITGAVISKGTAMFKAGKDEKKKPTAGSDYKQRPRTKNTPDPATGNGQNAGQAPSVGGGNYQTSGQMPSVGGGGQQTAGANAQTAANAQTMANDQARGTAGGINMDYAPTPGPVKQAIIKGAKSLGKGVLKANVNTGLRIAGLALGLSTGELNTGIAGWGLGSAQADRINTAMKKHTIKKDEDARHAGIANNIDDFQDAHNLTNTQVMQRAQDWMDGVSMPDRDDEAGLKLYQQLMEEQEILKDQGKSSEETREIIDQVIKDSLSGAQSRVPKASLAQRVINKFSNQDANNNGNTTQRTPTTRQTPSTRTTNQNGQTPGTGGNP